MDFSATWTAVFGPEGSPTSIAPGQMAMRAVLAVVVGLALLRAGGHRILARYSAIDVVVAIMLGSILSRVVSGTAPTLASFAAAAALVVCQRLLAAITWWSKKAGVLLKGRPHRLFRGGEVERGSCALLSISKEDMEEAIRLAGHSPDDGVVREMWLERDGRISVIPERAASPRNTPDSRPRFE